MSNLKFHRGERLKSRKIINQLFSKGSSIGQYPFRWVWIDVADPLSDFPIQFTVSVPKRKFPKAVQRNRIKRQVREAYRLHKDQLYESQKEVQLQKALMVIYTGKEEMSSKEIHKTMRKSVRKLIKIWQEANPTTNPN